MFEYSRSQVVQESCSASVPISVVQEEICGKLLNAIVLSEYLIPTLGID